WREGGGAVKRGPRGIAGRGAAPAMIHPAIQQTKRAGRHRLWAWCAAGLLVLLVGCSLTFAYRYADWIILWELDHYFDLTPEQRHHLHLRLTPLLAPPPPATIPPSTPLLS